MKSSHVRIAIALILAIPIITAQGCTRFRSNDTSQPSNLINPNEIIFTQGDSITFRDTVSNFDTDTGWALVIEEFDQDEAITFNWERNTSSDGLQQGRKRLTNLTASQSFNPTLINEEDIETEATMPWISRAVFEDLKRGNNVPEYKEGGLSASGELTTIDLTRDDGEQFATLMLNNVEVTVPMLSLNNGLFKILDSAQNPLVLEYNPIGIPGITNFIGWHVTDIFTEPQTE
jgi:hypothetical protein